MGEGAVVGVYKQGDTVKAFCAHCRIVRIAFFEYRDYKSISAGKVVPNILQAFCGDCGTLVGIPDQSAQEIRKNLEKE